MSTKKLVWLKLREDFFRSVSVKKLRRMAGGDTYTLLYLRMLLYSLHEDGHIYYQGIGDDFADEIALALDESEDDVKVCIAFLFSAKLIEQISDSDIFFVDAARMTGSECQSASRVRAMRERRKQEALQCNAELLQCNAEVTSSNENVTTEYREKSIEKRVKKKEKRDISAQSDLEIAHEPEETVNNKSVDSKQYTVSSTQKTDTVVPVEYGYSIDTVSCGADECALTDYQSVVDDYLSTCSRLPAVKLLSEARKKTIKARLNTYTAEQLHEAFKRANESDFLCGKNDRDWVATFDWILKDANLAKILDGNYENRSGRGGNIPDYNSPASLKMSL